MPRLTTSERRKLVLFLALLFAVANLIAVGWARRQFAESSGHLRRLRTDLSTARAWNDDRDLWLRRADWLAKNQPRPGAAGEGSAALLGSLQQAAQGSPDLTISDTSLKDPRATPYFVESSLDLRVAGPLESLCRWMTTIQQPVSFQAVTRFSLKSEGSEGDRVRCELTVARWAAPH